MTCKMYWCASELVPAAQCAAKHALARALRSTCLQLLVKGTTMNATKVQLMSTVACVFRFPEVDPSPLFLWERGHPNHVVQLEQAIPLEDPASVHTRALYGLYRMLQTP
jgi:hypothetical protein